MVYANLFVVDDVYHIALFDDDTKDVLVDYVLTDINGDEINIYEDYYFGGGKVYRKINDGDDVVKVAVPYYFIDLSYINDIFDGGSK